MSYLHHLEELRRRLIVCGVAILVAFVAAWVFAWDILAVLKEPAGNITLHYMSPMEPFTVRFKLALFGSLLIAFPVILFEILGYVTPALKKKERLYSFGALALVILFFASGVAFGYRFIMPSGITWLFNVAEGQMTGVVSASSYISFAGWFMLGLGVAFETPMFIWMLVALGIVTPQQLQRGWRYAIIIILLAAAIITPDWSPVTMVLIAVPMFFLFLISLAMAWMTVRFKERRKEAGKVGEDQG